MRSDVAGAARRGHPPRPGRPKSGVRAGALRRCYVAGRRISTPGPSDRRPAAPTSDSRANAAHLRPRGSGAGGARSTASSGGDGSVQAPIGDVHNEYRATGASASIVHVFCPFVLCPSELRHREDAPSAASGKDLARCVRWPKLTSVRRCRGRSDGSAHGRGTTGEPLVFGRGRGKKSHLEQEGPPGRRIGADGRDLDPALSHLRLSWRSPRT